MKLTVFQLLKLKFTQSNESSKYHQQIWYRENYNRKDAERYLMDKPVGVFVIRKSETFNHNFVLSVKVAKFINPSLVSHYLIIKSKRKSYSIKGYSKEFQNLQSLVTHCSMVRDILPVLLDLNQYTINSLATSNLYESNSCGASITTLDSLESIESTPFTDSMALLIQP